MTQDHSQQRGVVDAPAQGQSSDDMKPYVWMSKEYVDKHTESTRKAGLIAGLRMAEAEWYRTSTRDGKNFAEHLHELADRLEAEHG